MALNARDFTLPGQWAKEANTTIPPIPIRGQAYRNAALAKAIIENGQNYDNIADSAVWNQLMYLASGMSLESEQYGIPRWSPLTDYAGGASLAIGTDGTPYRAVLDSGPSGAGPQDPTTTTGYWQSLADWVVGGEENNFWILKRLTAAMDVYVNAATGNDTTARDSSGTVDSPFLTIQAAVNYVAENYYLGPYNVTIHVAAGTYNENVDLPQYQTTTGTITIQGDTYSSTYVTGVGAVGNSVHGTISLHRNVEYSISGLTITAPTDTDDVYNDDCIITTAGHLYLRGCNFVIPINNNSSFGIHTYGGWISLQPSTELSTLTISAVGASGSGAILTAGSGGLIHIETNLITNGIVTIAVAYAIDGGVIYRSPSVTPTISGAMTGPRYLVRTNGVINTQGGGPNYFPGTIVGAADTGGQYL